jgi:hypothetical protein
MKVFGTVKDASKEEHLSGAKVAIFVGSKELAVLFSDTEGRFEHKETTDYAGKTLVCKVEKEGFIPQEVSYEIEKEEVQLEIELVAKEAPKKEEVPISMPKTETPPSPQMWPKIAVGIGVLIAVGIIVSLFIPKTKPNLMVTDLKNLGRVSGNSYKFAYTIRAEGGTVDKKFSIGLLIKNPTSPNFDVREKWKISDQEIMELRKKHSVFMEHSVDLTPWGKYIIGISADIDNEIKESNKIDNMQFAEVQTGPTIILRPLRTPDVIKKFKMPLQKP